MYKLTSRVIGVIVLMTLTFGSYTNIGASSEAAAANTYYVSVTGNDANAGTLSAPFKTIQKCANIAGSTCRVQAGTYNEGVKLDKGGVTLLADGKVITKQINIPSSNNTVIGFSITDATANNGFQVSGNFNLVENNEIYQTKQDGIWFFGHDNTFRGNYIHDIIDPSITGDPHADCFQTWDWNWDTYNVLIEGNTCNHTRTKDSNQIVMVSGSRVHDVTFRNNRFIMNDAGYSPLALYGGTGYMIESNYFCNSTGKGTPAIYLDGAANVTVSNNTHAGYSSLVSGNGVTANSGNVQGLLPCQVNATPVVPTATSTTVPFTPTAMPTSTIPMATPTSTPLPANGPSVSTIIIPTSINVGGVATVNVNLNNIPVGGYTSAEFTCTYNPAQVEASSIAVANPFGADPLVAINGPQNGSFILAIAGSKGNRATVSGTVFTFSAKGLQAGQAVIECKARVSKGDNILVDIPSTGGANLTIGSVPTVTPTPAIQTTGSAPTITSTPLPTFTSTPLPATPTAMPTLTTPTATPTSTPLPANQPSLSTIIIPTSINIGGVAKVNVNLNNIPVGGYTSAEFTCTYNPAQVEASSIAVANLFGADPLAAINGPQNGSFLLAVAGSNGNRATVSGTAFTFSAKGLQAGQAVIECKARVSKGDNILVDIPSTGGANLTIGSVPTVTPTPAIQTTGSAPTTTPTPLPNFTPTPLPAPVITGKVLASKPVTIRLYKADNSLATTLNANPDGTFNFTAPAGTYTITATASGFLSAQGSITLTNGNTRTMSTVTLPAGDIDGNGVIDQFDVLTIGMSYNSANPPAADLNNDGTINVLDMELPATNYRKAGAVAWQ